MTCDSVQPFLEAYVDQELDASNSLTMAEHLKTCESCSRLRERLEALRSVIAAEAPRYRVPSELRTRIQSDLRDAAVPVALPLARRKRPLFDWKWAAIAAALFLSTVSLWQILLRQGPGQEQLVAGQVVSSHVRALMLNHLVDQPSSDQHTVKPWFAGKLDFSPAVKNLDAQGFLLTGGRLDYIDNRAVAAIVYRRRQHVINLFVWPTPKSPGEARDSETVNGYNVVSWRSEGMQYWAISDLNQQELDSFSRLVSHD